MRKVKKRHNTRHSHDNLVERVSRDPYGAGVRNTVGKIYIIKSPHLVSDSFVIKPDLVFLYEDRNGEFWVVLVEVKQSNCCGAFGKANLQIYDYSEFAEKHGNYLLELLKMYAPRDQNFSPFIEMMKKMGYNYDSRCVYTDAFGTIHCYSGHDRFQPI